MKTNTFDKKREAKRRREKRIEEKHPAKLIVPQKRGAMYIVRRLIQMIMPGDATIECDNIKYIYKVSVSIDVFVMKSIGVYRQDPTRRSS